MSNPTELQKLNVSEKEVQQKIAWSCYQTLQESFTNQAKLFLYIGMVLKRIRDEKLYKYLGDGGYDTFKMFLKNPEISRLAPSTLMAYIRIYEYYIERLEILEGRVLEIGTNRLQKLLPRLKEKPDDEARAIVEDIGLLGHDDYKKEVREKGLEIPKPSLFLDKLTGKYILEFETDQVLRIYNRSTNTVIFGEPFDRE